MIFFSNKPQERLRACAKELTRLGISTSPDKVTTSSLALARETAGATVFLSVGHLC